MPKRIKQAWPLMWIFLKKRWGWVLLTLLLLGLVLAFAIPLWTGDLKTGFDEYQPVFSVPPNPERAKTFWDWMELLLVPFALALGAAFFTWVTNRREREIEQDRARDAALRAYLDSMTVLLREGLRESTENDVMRGIARALTLTVLRQLDGPRKGLLLQFLYESVLIGHALPNRQKTRTSVIRLDRADLSGIILPKANLRGVILPGANLENADLRGAALGWADLSEANLRGACLRDINIFTDYIGSPMRGPLPHMNWLSEACMRQADLRNADLRSAYLRKVNLINAKLEGADLTGADLSEACLRDATVSIEQLAEAASLEGATLPDNTVHE